MRRKKRVLVIAESSTAYGRKIARGIAQYVQERGHWYVHIEDRGVFEIPHIVLDGWDGDGIITRTVNAQLSLMLKKCNCPIVELMGYGKKVSVEVRADEEKMSELCVNHFLERGFKNLAFYSFGRSWWIDRRCELFLNAATEKHFNPLRLSSISESDATASHPVWKKEYEKTLTQWLTTLPSQTGLIAASDSQAMRVLQSCQKIGIKVPEEIAVLGIDNDVHLCNLLTPQLSSLDQNVVQIGYTAARLLDLKMSRRKIPTLPILIPPLYVVTRRSTDVMAIDDPDIAAALHFIGEHAIQGIRVSDVVNETNLSKSTLIRQFRKILGRSPKDEIIRVCLNHAQRLLIHTNLPIHVVAQRSGYQSVEYFVTMFHKRTGKSPLQFRHKHQMSDYVSDE